MTVVSASKPTGRARAEDGQDGAVSVSPKPPPSPSSSPQGMHTCMHTSRPPAWENCWPANPFPPKQTRTRGSALILVLPRVRMAGTKPFPKEKAVREASCSKPRLRPCTARTALRKEIPLSPPRAALTARGAARSGAGRAVEDPGPDTGHRQRYCWSSPERSRESRGGSRSRRHRQRYCSSALTWWFHRGARSQTCALNCTITTFQRRSGVCCCLGAPVARPATAGRAILPDNL